MVLLRFTKEEFLYLGLYLAGFTELQINNTNDKTNNERFVSWYFANPTMCSKIFEDLQTTNIEAAKLEDPTPKNLLLALYFLKRYPTKSQLAAFNKSTEKTALKWAWIYCEKLQAMKEAKIVWLFDDEIKYQEKFIITVDGVHCQINEPRDEPSAGWFSKKYNKAGVTYEIAIAIFHNQVVWTIGPFPAGHNDKKVFKEKGLYDKIPKGKFALADDGYTGYADKCSTRNKQYDSDSVKEFKRRALARHETFNGKLKQFAILNQPFRGRGASRMVKHQVIFEACVVLGQYQMENGSPLFSV